MNKKYIIAAVALLALGVGILALRSSSPEIQKKRVGIVSFGGAQVEAILGLQEGMSGLGYTEGTNIEYLVRDAGGSDAKAKEAAEEFLRAQVDAVYSLSTPVTKQVADVIKTIPVVFNIVSDPVGSKLVSSLLSSGNNLTGCSNFVGQTGPKRLEALKEILPAVNTVLVIYDPENFFSKDAIVILRNAAVTLGISLAEKKINSKEEVIAVMRQAEPGEYDAFFHLGEAKVTAVAQDVIDLANKIKLPTFGHEEGLAQNGMLATLGPSWQLLGRQCAEVLAKVLHGEAPTNIPIQIPEKIELVLNLSTARAIGVKIPAGVLVRADKVIE